MFTIQSLLLLLLLVHYIIVSCVMKPLVILEVNIAYLQIVYWISGLANCQWVKRWLRRRGFTSWTVFLCILQNYFFPSCRIISILDWYIIAMAFKNLALFETWQFVPNSSKGNCGNSFKPKVVIFVVWVKHNRVMFITVENLQHILCIVNANKYYVKHRHRRNVTSHQSFSLCWLFNACKILW